MKGNPFKSSHKKAQKCRLSSSSGFSPYWGPLLTTAQNHSKENISVLYICSVTGVRSAPMTLAALPKFVKENYETYEWKHASAILSTDFPQEWNDIIQVLLNFRLYRSEIVAAGGGRSPISIRIDNGFRLAGWKEKGFRTKVVVDDAELEAPTHKVDCFKNRVALEVEWNNKTEFYDRDLNNFRLLFDLRAVSVGIIITRSSSLETIFRKLSKYPSYGQSSTHMNKLLPRLRGGSGGGCPVLVFGITERLYVED